MSTEREANTTQRWPIGTKFVTRGKAPRNCTVIDVWRTYNAAGELVKLRYVCAHHFLGQQLIDHDVVDTTIALGAPRIPTHDP